MKINLYKKIEEIKGRMKLCTAAFILGAGLSLTGCGDADAIEPTTPVTSEVVSENEVSENEVSENEVSENEVSEEEIVEEEMTLEERIAAEIPAKLEVGEDEVIVPETVTADQIMARMEEIRVTDHEYAEMINDMNMAGMLVLNCSYMEPSEFNALVNEHFGSVDELMYNFSNYRNYLGDSNGIYGNGMSVLPEELFFDEYLINQAEQLHYLFEVYQNDTENSKGYYNVIVDYVYRGENEYLTFDCDDERLVGSGLASLQCISAGVIVDDLIVYDTDLFNSGVGADTITNISDIVYEHSNQISR